MMRLDSIEILKKKILTLDDHENIQHRNEGNFPLSLLCLAMLYGSVCWNRHSNKGASFGLVV